MDISMIVTNIHELTIHDAIIGMIIVVSAFYILRICQFFFKMFMPHTDNHKCPTSPSKKVDVLKLIHDNSLLNKQNNEMKFKIKTLNQQIFQLDCEVKLLRQFKDKFLGETTINMKDNT